MGPEFQYAFIDENNEVSLRNLNELIKETAVFSNSESIQEEIFKHRNWLIGPRGLVLVVDLIDPEKRKAFWVDTKTSSASSSFDFDNYFAPRKTAGALFLTTSLAEEDSDKIRADINKVLRLFPKYKACLFVVESKNLFQLNINKKWRLKCLTDSEFGLVEKSIESKKASDYLIWTARKPLKRTSELFKEVVNYRTAKQRGQADLGTGLFEDLGGKRVIIKETIKGKEKSEIGGKFDESTEAKILTVNKEIPEIPDLSEKGERLLRALEWQEIKRARDEEKFLFTKIGETVKTENYCYEVDDHPGREPVQISLKTGWINQKRGEQMIFYDEFCPFCDWRNYNEIRVKPYKRIVDGKLVSGWVVKDNLW